MRTTISINDKLLHLVKRQALDSHETVSAIIEAAIKQQLLEDFEDMEDIATYKKAENQSTMSYDELVAELKGEGLLG